MNWKLIKVLFIIGIVVCLGIFIYSTDFTLVLSQIRSIGYGFLWVLLCSFGAHICGTIAWSYCFKNRQDISLIQLFYIRTIGENITLFNPTNIIAGEASKYQLLQDSTFSKNEKLDSLLLSRACFILSQIVLAILCIFWIAVSYDAVYKIAIGGITLSIIALLMVALLRKSVAKLSSLSERLKKWFAYIQDVYKRLISFSHLHKRKVLIAFLFSLLHWVFGAGEIFVILSALQEYPHFLDCLVVDTGVVILKSLAGFIPGQIGIEEAGNKWMLSLAGISSASIWLTVSIIRRGKQLFWIALSIAFYAITKKNQSQKLNTHGHSIYHA